MQTTHKAPIKWAQNKERVFITVETPDLANHKVELKPEGKLTYSGTQGSKTYAVDILMYDEIDVDKSKWNAKGRNTIFNIAKKNVGPFWPRLLKDEKKDPNIKADWDKWIDEDEEESKPTGEWDPSKMEDINPEEFKSDSDDEEEEAKGDLEKEQKIPEPTPAPMPETMLEKAVHEEKKPEETKQAEEKKE